MRITRPQSLGISTGPKQQKLLSSATDNAEVTNAASKITHNVNKHQVEPVPSTVSARSLSRKPALSPLCSPTERIGNTINTDPSDQLQPPKQRNSHHETVLRKRSSNGHSFRSRGHHSSEPAQKQAMKNDGVVMFFDGLHVHQVE